MEAIRFTLYAPSPNIKLTSTLVSPSLLFISTNKAKKADVLCPDYFVAVTHRVCTTARTLNYDMKHTWHLKDKVGSNDVSASLRGRKWELGYDRNL